MDHMGRVGVIPDRWAEHAVCNSAPILATSCEAYLPHIQFRYKTHHGTPADIVHTGVAEQLLFCFVWGYAVVPTWAMSARCAHWIIIYVL